MASVLVPVLYISIVITSLLVFSHFYRKRNAGKLYEPYFPSHPERDIYVSLLQKNDPPANETLLKSALVRRAMTDVGRVLRLREDKPALQNLLQKGSIGDDLWNSMLQAEKELEAEIMEVVAEANTFVEGWGSIIFQTANEMIANEKMRGVFENTASERARKEQKYGKIGKHIEIPTLQPVFMQGPPPPGASAPGVVVPPAAGAAKSVNGLVPPTGGRPESVASSDGEGLDDSSKSPSKKSKKRK
ncbi:Pre protein translocase subunit Sec66-domain-containing protein [Hygrophoropsis aurantiaca]|uniref:Pre protein translocase subunit Sec66-domain-containing protein n=1 Tax=Hygrophoropsis aurantiaca TaxID=72124 RepID=A0ACB8AQ24_9AGAM|nr:Pre protein translocase subunit Sec66-domain-containing protein [Hygrophoropsis aurantiaca]